MAAPAFSVSGLTARVRSRCDMVGSGFVTDAEILDWMEAAWQELYGIASIQYEDLLVQVVDLSLAQGSSTLSLGAAADMKRLRAFRIKNENFLTPISIREMQGLDRAGRVGRPEFYWLNGGMSIPAATILPPADRAYTITCYFQPAIQLADVAIGVSSIPQLAGWDEYVVLSAAIKCKDKEESSVAVLVGERTSLLTIMQSTWTPMDTSEAGRVVRIRDDYGGRSGMRAYDYQGPDDDFG